MGNLLAVLLVWAQAPADAGWLDGVYMGVFWVALVVFVLVEGAIIYSVVRFRRHSHARQPGSGSGATIMDIVWTVIPALVAAVIFVLVFRAMLQESAASATEGSTAAPIVVSQVAHVEGETPEDLPPAADATAAALRIVITGKPWWWEVFYPEGEIFTATDIYIPVGEPVLLQMSSENEAHTWWAPPPLDRLEVEPDATTYVQVQANAPGIYMGECAAQCDNPLAFMPMPIVALPADEFARWLAQRQEPAPQPATPLAERGEALMRSRGCLGCHALRGVSERSHVGSDMSGMASRSLIAGVLPYSQENMRRWLRNPADIKPGTRMPALNLSEEELDALVFYIHTLE